MREGGGVEWVWQWVDRRVGERSGEEWSGVEWRREVKRSEVQRRGGERLEG